MPNQQPIDATSSCECPSRNGANRRAWLHGCVLPAAILAAFFCWLIESNIFGERERGSRSVVIDWAVKIDAAGEGSIGLQIGNDVKERRVPMVPGADGMAFGRVVIPREGDFRSLVITPIDRPANVVFEGVKLQTLNGKWTKVIPASAFKVDGPAEAQRNERSIFIPKRAVPPPGLVAEFAPAFVVEEPSSVDWGVVLSEFAFLFAIFAALLRWGAALLRWPVLLEKCRRNPRRAIFVTSIVGVLLSCYPIVFCGKSWVSPYSGQPLIYKGQPTMPNIAAEEPENPAGSDSGATLTYHWPAVFQAHRAAIRNGEVPLWNRYSWCGISQVGQFFHMWGDPLHWLPIATGGASWAWDVKGLLTRLVYAFGCGLLVFRTCGSLRVAFVLTVSACFHGFFIFRTAHVAVFAFAYMPWVLLAWVEAARAESPRAAIRWAAMLAFASWQGLNGGTAKEATLTIAAMNVTGCAMLLASNGAWGLRLRKLAWMLWANVLLLFLSAPLWMPLLESMRNGVCFYQDVKVHQLQPALAIGLFDDIFQRQLVPKEHLLSAGANFLILLGTLWSIASFRLLRKSAVFCASFACVFAGGAVAFGFVPASLLAKIPVLQTVYHFDITFSFLIFTPLLVVAGFGLREMWENVAHGEWRWDYAVTAVCYIVLFGAFLGFTEASHRSGLTVHAPGEEYFKSAFFWRYSALLSVSLLALPWFVRSIASKSIWAPAASALGLIALFAMHVRHGAHLETSFDLYTYNPKSSFDYRSMRVDGLDFIKHATAAEPARCYGLNETLMPGFSVIPGIENICGAEAFESRPIAELFAAIGLGRTWRNWSIDVTTANYPKLQRALDFINVRYIVDEPGAQMPQIATLPTVHKSDLQIGESKTAWPRAFFTDSASPAESPVDVAKLLAAGDGRPFAAIAPELLTKHPLLTKPVTERVVSAAKDYHLTSNSTAFEIDAASPGVAVLHETNIPGDIVAKVDGREVPCILVNGAFRGAWIESAGLHRVEFTFAPRVWAKSLKVAALGGVLVLLTIAVVLRKFPKRVTK